MTKVGKGMRVSPVDPGSQLSFAISKIQDGGRGHHENSKKRNVSAMKLPILTQFCTKVRLEPPGVARQ